MSDDAMRCELAMGWVTFVVLYTPAGLTPVDTGLRQFMQAAYYDGAFYNLPVSAKASPGDDDDAVLRAVPTLEQPMKGRTL